MVLFCFFLGIYVFSCPTYSSPQSVLEAFFSLIQIFLSLLSAYGSLLFPVSLSCSFQPPSQPSVHACGISLSVLPPRHISLFSCQLSQHFIPAPYVQLSLCCFSQFSIMPSSLLWLFFFSRRCSCAIWYKFNNHVYG